MWELRLDVTVPVSVGVGANGNDQSILTPEMGVFQVKSRTVMPVAVDQKQRQPADPGMPGSGERQPPE